MKASEPLNADTFREQIREWRRVDTWRRVSFVSWSAGIALSLAIVVVEAARSGQLQGGPPKDRWLVAAVIPLVLLPFVPTFYMVWRSRRYVRLMKMTGRDVTAADANRGEWRIETFIGTFVRTKWWRFIVGGIFTLIIGYKLVRLFAG